MGIERRRFVKIVAHATALLALPVLKLGAPIMPCLQAVRSRLPSIPVKRLGPDDIMKPGRWGG